MKPAKLLLPLLLATFLSACSNNPDRPSEADVRAVVEQQIQNFSQGCIKLLQFQMNKDQERELGSVLLVKATAEIEFLEDCKWPFDSQLLALKTTGTDTPDVKKGDRRTVHLTIQFHKTPQGWKPTQ